MVWLKEKTFQYIDVIFFVIVLTTKYIFYEIQILGNFKNALGTLLPNLTAVLILAGFTFLLKAKTRSRCLYFINLLLSIIITADIIYFRYYNDILSVLVMKNGLLLSSVKSSVYSLFKFSDLLYFLDLLIMPFILLKKNKFLTAAYKPLPFIKRFAVSFAILVISVGINAKCFYDLSIAQHTLLTTMYNRIYIAKILGNLNFHSIDVYNFAANEIKKKTPVSAEKKVEIESVLTTNGEKDDLLNIKSKSKNKNLIIIQVEALQQFVINTKVNGVEITPNLNKWAGKSVYYDNYFYQVSSGNTSDAEFMTQNSLYPAANGAVCNLFFQNTFNSLPKAFNNIGYDTFAMHGYVQEFWNRRAMNKSESFNNFYAEEQLNLDEKVGMGISDKSFFNQSLAQIEKNQKPFYAFLTTLSSHFPYDDIKNYGEFNSGEYEGTLLGNYFKAIHYTDAQIGMFLDKLQADGILNNSIVVIYGDHYAIPEKESASLYKLLGIDESNELTWQLLQKVPLIMHFPKDKFKGVNHTFSGEMDLYPTIATIFDLPHAGLLGKNLIHNSTGDVVFRNGSTTDGEVFYMAGSNTYYDISSGNKLDETPVLKALKEKALNQLEMSDTILSNNLFKDFTLDIKK